MPEERGPNSAPVAKDSFAVSAPSISLPKGGGAIRGMGEKFAANPVSGTASLSVPIAISPGRSGFSPQLSLSYDSGSGNGPFGFGWHLSLPSITRKTDKGLPRYHDGDDSDVFILSGAEDLVPEFKKGAAPGEWAKDAGGNFVYDDMPRDGYLVRRYRPRIEGLFARIERWANQTDPADVFWRSISKDNITTYYGRKNESRVCDPADERRIFSWSICESYDDKGNAILYGYKPEDDSGVDKAHANARNRENGASRHLKYVRYGNTRSQVDPAFATREAWRLTTQWLFEVVFDYGEHSLDDPTPNDPGAWLCRHDPFSGYRAGFEVRTNRLCQRVLMFHHFPLENIGSNCLVRSTDFVYRDSPIASFIASVTQRGYKRKAGGGYLNRSLPPLEFEYSEAQIQDAIREVDADSLENLPIGLDGAGYQWVDLDGEGVSGILSEQADAWFYKRNLSPISTTVEGGVTRSVAAFAPIERVAEKPAFAATGAGGWQFQDLAGDGQPDLARFDGSSAGFFERNDQDKWDTFVPFRALPNVNWQDPNLRFVDLTGDGRADVLITEDQAFTCHLSLGEIGFAPSERTLQALDEERGPRLVFADGEQSIHLADLSGDGLTDLVRIRNGEVCYWPNLGYGRFGAKVTMDNAPRFDARDQFSQHRIRLADVDGSGVTDILYLGGDGITVYFNQSGNGWSAGQSIPQVPHVDNLAAVQVVDLFGNGTACLVWSSPLPGAARRPMRYIDLMGGQKPHLLVKTVNNLGAESRVQYASSTKFYLRDKAAGTPWITKLPFPVHVVEKVTVTDKWRHTEFATTYSYHHGYFDGLEREFRGFGRVEQIDVEDYGTFAAGNAASPYITADRTLYQPPVKTITWFHTGAAIDRERILRQFQAEYFPHALAARPATVNIDRVFAEKPLPEPDLESLNLTAEEWREALRACKGMTLRQEVYELDVDVLERSGDHVPVRLFSTATHNCNVHRLQPKGDNQHAVFLVTESEALSYHYELDLRPPVLTPTLAPDPRVAHTLNLSFDELGNVQQSIAAGYPRTREHQDAALTTQQIGLVHEVQRERHLAYSETLYTKDAIGADYYRLRLPCEIQTCELTGVTPARGFYFDLSDFRRYRLSDTLPNQGSRPVVRKQYHELPQDTLATLRLVEHARTLFFKGDLSGPLDLGILGKLGLTYEQYKLALTRKLLDAIFTAGQLDQQVLAGSPARDALNDWRTSGYLSGADATNKFGPEAAGQYWMRSGVAGFAPDAAQHYYLPEKYTDPFDNETTLKYDGKYDLFIQSSADALGNTTRVTQFDYRVLAPVALEDINANHTEAYFDVLGRVIAVAAKGKGNEADNLIGYDDALANPELREVLGHFDLAPLTAIEARDMFSPILGNATSRYLYHFGEARDTAGNPVWGDRPAGACAVVREQHVAKVEALRLVDANAKSPLQIAFECSDGMGTVLMKRSQAEPGQAGGPLRWIVSGKTVLNNKGKPVKQYEPYFSARASCSAEGDVHEEVGVTPLMYYDAVGRLVRTEMPDGTVSRVEFSPWHVNMFDANDTVLESQWYQDRGAPALTGPEPGDPEMRAAWLAAHHAGTPARTVMDSLGRDVISIAHNRYKDSTGALRNENYLTCTRLDAEGKPLWIRDALGNLVMQYIWPPVPNDHAGDPAPGFVPCYDVAGNLLFQHSMDAGDRWMLADAAGKPMMAWDTNDRVTGIGPNVRTVLEERLFLTAYDRLHRPTGLRLKINSDPASLVEAFDYCDTGNFVDAVGAVTDASGFDDARSRNILGQSIRHWDPSGFATVERIDFAGHIRHVTRTLVGDVTQPVVNWDIVDRSTRLEADSFIQVTDYDALGRMTTIYNWHRDDIGTGRSSRVAIYTPAYNERGLLQAETVHVRASKHTDPNGQVSFSKDPNRSEVAIRNMAYDAKGQKAILELGNGTTTRYTYDPNTFRLVHLYTRRGDRFTNDCSSANADAARPARPCGVQNLHYTYDPVGSITHVQDDAQPTIWFSNQQVEPSSSYTYDALYRVIEATGRENAAAASPPAYPEGDWPSGGMPSADATRNYTQRYDYDEVGNFVRVQHVAADLPGQASGSWTRNYTVQPDSNRLNQTWYGSDTTRAVTYRHDSHGNMLNLERTAPGLDVRWNWRDMIGDMDLGGGGWAYYNYGIDKQRTRKRLVRNPAVGGTIREDRIYLGGYELYRRYTGDPDDPVEEIESHHLFEGEQRVLLVDDVIHARSPRPDALTVRAQTLFRYQYSNHLGSACLELDHDAEIISYEEYHPYGTSAYRLMNSAAEAPPKRYRHMGMERDEESGLNYHGARCYVPWLCRWLSPDPSGLADGVNLFRAFLLNPALRDTSGRQTASDVRLPERFYRPGALLGVCRDRVPGVAAPRKIHPADLPQMAGSDPLWLQATRGANSIFPPKQQEMFEHTIRGPVLAVFAPAVAITLGAAGLAGGAYYLATEEYDKAKAAFFTSLEVLPAISPTYALTPSQRVAMAIEQSQLTQAARTLTRVELTAELTAEQKWTQASLAEQRAAHTLATNATVTSTELKEALKGLDLEGTSMVVEVGPGTAEFYTARAHGGAYHDLSTGKIYLNLDEMKRQLPETGLQTWQQVLLHELGHSGQSRALRTNAVGDVLPSARLEREAGASLAGAIMAKNPVDAAALRAHAARSLQTANAMNAP